MRTAVREVVSWKTRMLEAVATSVTSEIWSWMRTYEAPRKMKTSEAAHRHY